MAEALESLADAEQLGAISAEDFYLLVSEALQSPWRDAGVRADRRVALLTPIEARLEVFDRVILASMSDDVWPGQADSNPWLNLNMQKALGLPAPEEKVSLMAHDLLMLGSGREVYLTHAARKEGSPALRSRFIERLVTRLAAAG